MTRAILRIVPLVILFLSLLSCQESSSTLLGVQLRLVSFAGKRPATVKLLGVSDSAQGSLQPLARAVLEYLLSPEDTLQVEIQEYADPIQAYGYWCGSGLGPSRLPIVKGGFVEQTIWSGRWVFLFRSPPHRQPATLQMDSLVRSFPESGGGLPPIFLTLPLHNREEQGTTIQSKQFFGEPVSFVLLEQRYHDEIGSWNLARSIAGISEKDMDSCLASLAAQGFRRLAHPKEYSVWSDGEVQLVLGRKGGGFLAAWGRIDPTSLARRWSISSTSL